MKGERLPIPELAPAARAAAKETRVRRSAAGAEQWREIADAREHSEFRMRQQRVNDDQWLHADAPEPIDEQEPHEGELNGWFVAAVVTSVLVLLLSLYVLSCGATLYGSCSP